MSNFERLVTIMLLKAILEKLNEISEKLDQIILLKTKEVKQK